MRRIIVVGSQGSGKTSFALKLGRKLGLPVVHLDVLYWRPGWKPSDKASFRSRVAGAIAGDGWIIDGSFSGLAFDLTLARADTLVVIDRPRWLCQWRIAWRSAFDRNRMRPDLPEGCPEIRLELVARGVALQRRAPARCRGRAPHAWSRSAGRPPKQRPGDRPFRSRYLASVVVARGPDGAGDPPRPDALTVGTGRRDRIAPPGLVRVVDAFRAHLRSPWKRRTVSPITRAVAVGPAGRLPRTEDENAPVNPNATGSAAGTSQAFPSRFEAL
jgi:adenylate kinase family enzyme